MPVARWERKMARRLLQEIMDDHPEGCCLHVMYVDRNWGDETARATVRWAEEARHARCAFVADVFLRTPRAERRRL